MGEAQSNAPMGECPVVVHTEPQVSVCARMYWHQNCGVVPINTIK